MAEQTSPTPAPAKSFSDSIDRGPDWLQNWKNDNAQSGDGLYVKGLMLGDDDGSLIASPNGAGAPQQNRLSKDEVEFLGKYFSDQKSSSSADKSTSDARKFLPSSSFGPVPGITTPPSGPVSTVGGFDSSGNSLNGAQFDLGKSWVADVPKLPWNLGVSTVEGGINLLSGATPGAPDYVPFLSSARIPYNSQVSEYAEFGLGLALLRRGTTTRSTVAIGDTVATDSVLIGNSGYRSIGGFSDAVTGKYQSLNDQGYAIASQNASQGLIPNTSRAIGSDTDAFARVGLRDWLTNVEGIDEGPGKIIQVNRRLYDPLGSGAYRVPDVYIPGSQTILDGSISFKTGASPQIIDFGRFSGGAKTTIIAPSVTNEKPIQFINGRPDFSPWSKGQIKFEKGVLTGTDSDFKAVYEYVQEKKGYRVRPPPRITSVRMALHLTL